MRLIRRDGQIPPGGYPYQDPKTGFKFDGFQAGGFGEQVLAIIWHRIANPTIYTPNTIDLVPEFVANQLDEYTCLRLGNDRRFCTDEELPKPKEVTRTEPAIVPGRNCPGCGGNLVERLCGSCGGRKVVGYQCQACGMQINR